MRQEPMDRKIGITMKDTLRYCLQKTNTTKEELIERTGLPAEVVEEATTISCCNIEPEDIFKMCDVMDISKRFFIEMTMNFYDLIPEARECFMRTMACDEVTQRRILKIHQEYRQAASISREAADEYIKNQLESLGVSYDNFLERLKNQPTMIY